MPKLDAKGTKALQSHYVREIKRVMGGLIDDALRERDPISADLLKSVQREIVALIKDENAHP